MTFMIYECSKSHIDEVSKLLNEGGIIVYPTDTVYGIGCYPYYTKSINRIYEIKGRDYHKPLSILGSSIKDIENLVYLNEIGFKLAKEFWPGGLTIVAPLRDQKIPSIVHSGKNTLAVRIPNYECTLNLLNKCKYIIGTSANRSGEEVSSDYKKIIASIKGFNAIIKDIESKNRKESTIVEINTDKVTILREGAIPSKKIFDVIEQ